MIILMHDRVVTSSVLVNRIHFHLVNVLSKALTTNVEFVRQPCRSAVDQTRLQLAPLVAARHVTGGNVYAHLLPGRCETLA